jgi:hypothetical protein
MAQRHRGLLAMNEAAALLFRANPMDPGRTMNKLETGQSWLCTQSQLPTWTRMTSLSWCTFVQAGIGGSRRDVYTDPKESIRVGTLRSVTKDLVLGISSRIQFPNTMKE